MNNNGVKIKTQELFSDFDELDELFKSMQVKELVFTESVNRIFDGKFHSFTPAELLQDWLMRTLDGYSIKDFVQALNLQNYLSEEQASKMLIGELVPTGNLSKYISNQIYKDLKTTKGTFLNSCWREIELRFKQGLDLDELPNIENTCISQKESRRKRPFPFVITTKEKSTGSVFYKLLVKQLRLFAQKNAPDDLDSNQISDKDLLSGFCRSFGIVAEYEVLRPTMFQGFEPLPPGTNIKKLSFEISEALSGDDVKLNVKIFKKASSFFKSVEGISLEEADKFVGLDLKETIKILRKNSGRSLNRTKETGGIKNSTISMWEAGSVPKKSMDLTSALKTIGVPKKQVKLATNKRKAMLGYTFKSTKYLTLGQLLKNLRINSDLNLAQAEYFSGFTGPSIKEWEEDKVLPVQYQKILTLLEYYNPTNSEKEHLINSWKRKAGYTAGDIKEISLQEMLKNLRINSDLSIEDAGVFSNIQPNRISIWEKGGIPDEWGKVKKLVKSYTHTDEELKCAQMAWKKATGYIDKDLEDLSLGQILKNLRMDAGFVLSTRQYISSFHTSTIRSWEQGVSIPKSEENLVKILKTYKATQEKKAQILDKRKKILGYIFEDTEDLTFGQLLRNLRIDNDFSRTKTADISGFGETRIKKWEDDTALPEKLENIDILLEAYIFTSREREHLVKTWKKNAGYVDKNLENMELEEILKNLRIDAGLMLCKNQTIADIKTDVIYKWETGKSFPESEIDLMSLLKRYKSTEKQTNQALSKRKKRLGYTFLEERELSLGQLLKNLRIDAGFRYRTLPAKLININKDRIRCYEDKGCLPKQPNVLLNLAIRAYNADVVSILSIRNKFISAALKKNITPSNLIDESRVRLTAKFDRAWGIIANQTTTVMTPVYNI